MTNDDFKTSATVATPVLVILGRLWSMWEHRKTGMAVKENSDNIREIRISINGELEKKIKEAKEQGRKEGVEELNKVK